MGLRCSLVGHDWGESEIERDRDEQGSEVVLTVREYEVCARCDERNLISENTEVTTLATDEEGEPAGRAPEPTRDAADAAGAVDASGDASVADEPPADAAGDAGATAEASGDEQAPPEAGAAEIIGDDTDDGFDGATGDDAGVGDADAAPGDDVGAAAGDDGEPVDDAVFIDDAEDGDVEAVEDTVAEAEEPVDDAAPDPHGEAAPGATGDTEAVEAAADDDGVILDDDDADADVDDDREHGEWPDGPDGAGERASADASGAEGASGGAAGEAAGDAATGQLQEEPVAEDDGYDAEFIDGDEPATADSTDASASTSAEASPSGIKSAGSTDPPGQRHQRTGELVCPNCQNAESAERTSLRAGDICPECRKGYLSNPSE